MLGPLHRAGSISHVANDCRAVLSRGASIYSGLNSTHRVEVHKSIAGGFGVHNAIAGIPGGCTRAVQVTSDSVAIWSGPARRRSYGHHLEFAAALQPDTVAIDQVVMLDVDSSGRIAQIGCKLGCR